MKRPGETGIMPSRSPCPSYHRIGSDSTKSNVEERKSVFSTSILRHLGWHLPGLISSLGTAVLFYLNFSEHCMGAEVGKTSRQSRNFIGALQLTAKLHEMFIISSLTNIARQWIQLCLMGDGTILGLLGAETLFSNLSLLISREFWVASRCCLSALIVGRGYTSTRAGKADLTDKQQRLRRSLLPLLAFFLVGSFLCSLSGPASAVLMTPRQDWFHEMSLMVNLTEADAYVPEAGSHQPHIFIDPFLSSGGDFHSQSEDSGSLPYWYMDEYRYVHPNYWHTEVAEARLRGNVLHTFVDEAGIWHSVNTTIGSVDINIDPGSSWAGKGITFSTVGLPSRFLVNAAVMEYMEMNKSTPKCQGANTRFTADLTGYESHTVCWERTKNTCKNPGRNNTSRPEWCYNIDTPNTVGLERSNQDLVPIVTSADSTGTNVTVWMTEGPLLPGTGNEASEFSDSIIIVFENVYRSLESDLLIVCSTTSTLKTVTAVSSGWWSTKLIFLPDSAIFQDYTLYRESGMPPTYYAPRTFLYHKNWLDSMYEAYLEIIPSLQNLTGQNRPYTPRDQLLIPNGHNDSYLDIALYELGSSILTPGSPLLDVGPYIPPYYNSLSGIPSELVVGGSYLSFLLCLRPSPSQYTGIPFREGEQQFLPQRLMPENIVNFTKFDYIALETSCYVYGFRISNRTGTIGVVILSTHVLLVLLGSIWQCYRGTIIQSWKSIPEYATLCLGSDPAPDAVENTCAGIDMDKTLSRAIKIREMGTDHLELVVLAPGDKWDGLVVDKDKQYGYLGRKRRRNRKKKRGI